MGKQYYIGIDIVAAPFDEFMEIAEAELKGRLMVFHLKKKWWDLIMNGIKDREYRGDKWDKYIEPFMYMDIQGVKLYVELDLGYPKKGDFSRKMFFYVSRIIKEESKKEIGGDGSIKWATCFGKRIL